MKTGKKYKPWPKSEWTKTLPQAYFEQMEKYVNEMTDGWFSDIDKAEGYDDYVRVRHIYGRMEITKNLIMPFVCAAIPDLSKKTILEIGCGTGPSTVPLAMESSFVHAFDLCNEFVKLAQHRCKLLAINNVNLFSREKDWIDKYLENPASLYEEVDVIFCYALFEHLTPIERIKLLIGAWEHISVGGYFVIIETPNRLYWMDWHSSQIPFADQIPRELAYFWNSFSHRNSIPANIKATMLSDLPRMSEERLYRFGRGASFHEFYIALGPNSFKITNTQNVNRKELIGYNAEYVAILEHQLAKVQPPVHPAFANPCLDIVFRKLGPSRMSK